MTAVDAAVKPTKAAVRSKRYFAMLVFFVMSRPPKFVAGYIGQNHFRFAAEKPRIGFFNRFDCFVRSPS
jgi:hypothetical protein